MTSEGIDGDSDSAFEPPTLCHCLSCYDCVSN